MSRAADRRREVPVGARQYSARPRRLIARDELGKPEQAAKLLNEAIDDESDARALARGARRAARRAAGVEGAGPLLPQGAQKRLGPETGDGKNSERLRLWSALGDVCLDSWASGPRRSAALEVALTLGPQ